MLTSLMSHTKSDSIEITKEPLTFKYTFIPLPNYDPTTKFGITAVNMFTYKVNVKDTISPYSTGGLGIQFTTNGSITRGFGNTLYLNEDRWRLIAQGFVGRIHQDLSLGFEDPTSARKMNLHFESQILIHQKNDI